MTALLPKKIEELLELGRANGWTATTEDLETIPGLSRIVGVGFHRYIDDGRDLFFVVAYGRRLGSRPSWVLMHDGDGFHVQAEVVDEDVPAILGPDLTRRWKTVSDLRHWLEHADRLVELWTEDGSLSPRKSFRDRLIGGSS